MNKLELENKNKVNEEAIEELKNYIKFLLKYQHGLEHDLYESMQYYIKKDKLKNVLDKKAIEYEKNCKFLNKDCSYLEAYKMGINYGKYFGLMEIRDILTNIE